MKLADGDIISVVFRKDMSECSKFLSSSSPTPRSVYHSLCDLWRDREGCGQIIGVFLADVVYKFQDLSPSLDSPQAGGGGGAGEDDATLDLTQEIDYTAAEEVVGK